MFPRHERVSPQLLQTGFAVGSWGQNHMGQLGSGVKACEAVFAEAGGNRPGAPCIQVACWGRTCTLAVTHQAECAYRA